MSNPLDPTKQKILDYIRAELIRDPNRVFYLDKPFADKEQMNAYHDELTELEQEKIIDGFNDLPGGKGGAPGEQGVPHIGYKIRFK